MAHNENPDDVTGDAEQKMIWEPPQIDAPDVTLSNCEGLRTLRCLHHEVTQLRVELVGEF